MARVPSRAVLRAASAHFISGLRDEWLIHTSGLFVVGQEGTRITQRENTGGLMKRSGRPLHRAFFMSATVVAAAALTFAGVTASAVGAQSKPHAGPSQIGPGYPPPGGIYTSFTNCPLYNQLMHESVGFTACTA